ncbi:ABC transporter ATP-binding protein [Geodermatophilus sp. TF02-6]|uniref:ABC transporter ATP-binding protein n=1 Tax=Geodermatophilus sp. TF02-6 TaxID=2250575 RepID=UPI000DEB4BCB|nr:ABC transporter ATP-binding protein [Geodermatophilus sp. TF02-6]RBY78270.1 ABC transporter ATP-binding protein [Geodermatophilus sp. TF02-6]
MSMPRRLLRHLRPHAGALLLALVLALLAGLVDLLRPWTVKVVVDYVLGGRPLPPAVAGLLEVLPGPDSRRALLGWTVAVAVLLAVLGLWLSLVVARRVLRAAQDMVLELAREVFDKLQRLSLGFHGRHEVGDLLQRSTQDVFVGAIVAQTLLPGLVALITLVGMFLVLAGVDLPLAGVAMTVVPLLLAALYWFAPRLDRTTSEQFDRWGKLMTFVENALSAIKVVHAFSGERYVRNRVDADAQRVARAYAGSTFLTTAWEQSTIAVTGIGSAAVLGVGAVRVLSGSLTLGDLLVFTAYLSSLYAPLQSLAKAVGGVVEIRSRGRRVVEILDSDDDVPEPLRPVVPAALRGEVVWEGVVFGYDESRPVLRGVDLRAAPGEVTAIVGPSGVGKSSLASLVPRFYDPWQGRVLLDGIDVRDLPLRLLRHQVALVLQEPYLFPVSVADNIRFGSPGASRSDVEAAARRARADEFVEQLPDGYDTVLGEHGTTLSGGQAQRIALARALVRNAPVLVLDEPTSALDAETEADVLEAITAAASGRTVVLISHRQSTLAIADRTFEMRDGRLTERPGAPAPHRRAARSPSLDPIGTP